MQTIVRTSVVRRTATLSLLMLLAHLASGCGQKGPLTMPAPAAASAPAR